MKNAQKTKDIDEARRIMARNFCLNLIFVINLMVFINNAFLAPEVTQAIPFI